MNKIRTQKELSQYLKERGLHARISKHFKITEDYILYIEIARASSYYANKGIPTWYKVMRLYTDSLNRDSTPILQSSCETLQQAKLCLSSYGYEMQQVKMQQNKAMQQLQDRKDLPVIVNESAI